MGFLQDLGEGITGAGQARAARQGAAAQQAAAAEAGGLLRGYEGQVTGQLQPYEQFGQSFMPMAQQAAQQQQQLFGAGAGEELMNSPMFQALLGQANEEILGKQAALGRVGTTGTQTALQDAALRTGYGVLQNERQGAMANLQSLMGGVGMGQQAAGSIANALQQSGLNQANLITGSGAAEAGGLMGAANAKAQGAGNILGLGTAALTGGFSNPFSGGFGGAFQNMNQGVRTFFNPTQDLGGGFGPR